jgi:WD40 repeat protein
VFVRDGEGRVERRLRASDGTVPALAVSHNGEVVVSGDDSGEVRVWRAGDGAEVARIRGHGKAVTAIVVAPDAKSAASASFDGTVRLWPWPTRKGEVAIRGRAKAILAVAITADGHSLAALTGEGDLLIYDTRKGKVVATLERAHRGGCLAFHPEGRLLATGGDDNIIRLWDIGEGEIRPLRALRGHSGRVTGLSFTPDGRRLVSVAWDDTMKTWAVPGA